MKKVKFGMRSAYLILASVFLILVNLTLGLVLTNVSQKALIAQIEGRMLDIANTAADMINGDELERIWAGCYSDTDTDRRSRCHHDPFGIYADDSQKNGHCRQIANTGFF